MTKTVVLWLALAFPALAAEHRGTVTFGGLPAPGVTVTLTDGGKEQSVITDGQGMYQFSTLSEGQWTVRVEMQLFAVESREVRESVSQWELRMLPPPATLGRVVTVLVPAPVENPKKGAPAATNTKSEFQKTEVAAKQGAAVAPVVPVAPATADAELAQRAADGLLINGSVHNAATSPFAQLPAFGNHRRNSRSLYNGNLGLIMNSSVFDARSYSLTGQNTPKPEYTRLQGLFSFGGPMRIPRLLPRNGPIFTINYQWTRNTNAVTQSGLVPTAAERSGSIPAARDPLTQIPFSNGQIPASRISPQAAALLRLFPEANFAGSNRYNFQTPIVSGLHQDDLQTRINKQQRKNFYSGAFNWESLRTSTPDLYGFLSTGRSVGLNTTVNYRRTIHSRFFVNTGVQYSRQIEQLTPFFSHVRNISGDAGIQGNNQEPVNWGPPSLQFTGGVTPLTIPQASLLRNQTIAFTTDSFYNRGRHNLTFGGAHRRQQFNVLSQQDARGTFAFTGAAAGSDFAGFLLGVPDTSSIAFGNADKYLRGSIQEAFVNDDWRVNPGFTLNYGIRWDYWTPIAEKYGRLVNLDGGAQPVVGARLHPDRNNWSPRIGFSWRPLAASSLVVRGGYGIYYDTSIYQAIALQMAQQAPLSRSLRIANTPTTPLTLANGFPPADSATMATTFAVDPDLRVGYSQNWNLSLQRDLPAGLQIYASYNGGKGTRAQQQILPNTFPDRATPPSGYTFLTSNGASIRHAGQIQIRRRLRSGFTAQASYTYAKSLDNAALGGRNQSGALIAQNWLDLRDERGRSPFDQRHLLSASTQYTTGMGIRGGALATGWRAKALKDWTLGTQVTGGSGLPLHPVLPTATPGTGVMGNRRPDFTGLSLYDAPPGLFLNPLAVAIPASGSWGNAGRNSINGPAQFALAASLGRTFRSAERFSVDVRIDAANALNSVRFPSWNTVAGNAQFGLPVTANPMRTLQATLRTRF
ncbi:MAG TPA: carboxypeptidase regulatory-like domain-containing protein [Bryobacteraceae bacterium]|nr:carboxypeptidase regulatory-like domain-containing protein [Bryobacteraceae bacterium]